MALLRWVRAFAQWTSRTDREKELLGDGVSVWGKWLLIFAMAAPLVVILMPIISDELERTQRPSPSFALPAQRWEMKNSDSSLSLRTVVGPNDLQRILHHKAVYFYFTPTPGYTKVWADEQLLFEGRARSLSLPLILSFSLTRLAEDTPLPVTIQISAPKAESIAKVLKNKMSAGFLDIDGLRSFTRKLEFRNQTRPWIYFGCNLILASLFLLFWRGTPQKQEYSYMAIYALVEGIYQVRFLEVFESQVQAPYRFILEFVIPFYEGAFGLFLGLAFSRARRGLFKVGMPLAVLFPWLLPLFPQARSLLYQNLGPVLVPSLYCIGALSCFLQAHLVHHMPSSSRLATRRNRLLLFGFTLVALMSFHLSQAGEIESIFYQTLFYHLAHLGLVVFLGGIIIREHRDTAQLLVLRPRPEKRRLRSVA